MREMKDSGIAWIGVIPQEWKVTKVKFVCESMISGGTPDSANDSFYTEDGTPWVSIGDMSSVDFVCSTRKKISDDAIRSKNLAVLPVGTILYAMYASVGKVSELAIDATVNQALLGLKLKDNVSKIFFKYNLKAFEDYAFAESNGNTQFNMNANKVSNICITYPPSFEQEIIVSFLEKCCSNTDALIANVQAQIEQLKAYKQSMITEVVTKGLDPSVPMKDSGVEWLGQVPKNWAVHRIANLYSERSENGREDLPILTVSINTGVSDYEVADEDKDRVFIRMEDRSKYKRVCPGDLTYNMMRAWQGAFGAVRVDGMVSPAYVVAKPKNPTQIDSRYIEALLRTPSAIEEMHRYSRGIVDFRLRLYWPEFRSIHICLPPIEEQTQIADYIDEKSKQIDQLIAIKQRKIEKLNEYKKSLIYEYVTGKREVV